MTEPDWRAWHEPYADADSALSRRLRLVQQHIRTFLDERAGRPVAVLSSCACQGHDLLGVLSTRPDAPLVTATLLELDAENVALARAAARAAGLGNVRIVAADAGELASYAGVAPADLVLLVGVFGNISDGDVRRAVATLPALCAPRASVIWSRSRREPDLTPSVREWLRQEGFVEEAFHAPPDVLFSVGVHRFTGTPKPLPASGRIFTFVT